MADAIHQTSYAIAVDPGSTKPFGLAVTVKVEDTAVQCSLGVECFDEDMMSLGYRWCIVENSTSFTLSFAEYRGRMLGVGSAETEFPTGTKFIKPTARVDETDLGKAVWLDNWRVRNVQEEEADADLSDLLTVRTPSTTRFRSSRIYDDAGSTQAMDSSGRLKTSITGTDATLDANNLHARTIRMASLVPNGDFALKNSDDTPVDWTGTDSTVVISTTYSASGNQALKIPAGKEAYSTAYLQISPVKFYVIRFQIRTTGSVTAQIGVECYDKDKASLGRKFCVLDEAINFSDWRNCFMIMQGESTADVSYFVAATRYVRPVAKHNSGSNELWIDNVEIEVASPELLEQFGNGSDGVFSSANVTLPRPEYNFRTFVVNQNHTVKLTPGAWLRVWRKVEIAGTLTYV